MIKLFKVDETEDGAIRLQSQLYVDRGTVDFILEDGILKHWTGHSFTEIDIQYEIIETKEEMNLQIL